MEDDLVVLVLNDGPTVTPIDGWVVLAEPRLTEDDVLSFQAGRIEGNLVSVATDPQ